jgi:hypothetical protein
MDFRCEHQPLRIHQHMALAPLDLLGPIVAPLAAYTRRLDALTVNNGGARLGFPPSCYP